MRLNCLAVQVCYVLFQTHILFIHFGCRLDAHITEMPLLIHNAGISEFIGRVAHDKSVLVAVFVKPLIVVFHHPDIKAETGTMLAACCGNGFYRTHVRIVAVVRVLVDMLLPEAQLLLIITISSVCGKFHVGAACVHCIQTHLVQSDNRSFVTGCIVPVVKMITGVGHNILHVYQTCRGTAVL